MKLFSLLVVSVAVLGVSCERHEFEGPDGTKQLHEHHSAQGEADSHAEDAEKPAH
ncbi:MAG: hypothetical protein Q8Q59_15150 [Luteolibacter sp.]|nr:hypothetical protein [Luteolibacter sp.]